MKQLTQRTKVFITVCIGILLIGGSFFIYSQQNSTTDQTEEKEEVLTAEVAEPVDTSNDIPFALGRDEVGFWYGIKKQFTTDMGFPHRDAVEATEGSYPFSQDQELPYDAIVSTLQIENRVTERVADIEGIENTDTTYKLEYPRLEIEAPVKYAKYDQFFKTLSDGSLDLRNQIVENREDVFNGKPLTVPIQQLLTEGVVRIPISAFPGEVGNSYIIGHSSNITTVKSDYNFVFQNLQNAQDGDIFYVYDHNGLKLPFKVFDITVIEETDVLTAYKPFEDKRVVTLQGSVLETINGRRLPTKRILVRGELSVND